MDDWYCFDWTTSDFEFGGYWGDDYAYYFDLILYYCPYGQDYAPDIGCTKYDDFVRATATKERWYFSLMYPKTNFDPNNLQNPLKNSYVNYYYAIDIGSQKFDRFFFKNTIVNDDQGWIFSDYKNYTTTGFDIQQNDFYFLNTTRYDTPGIITKFYGIVFYFSKDYQLYSRSYMKFQDLCAIVGGFLKIILVLGQLVSYCFNNYLKSEYLSSEIFDFNGLKNDINM